MLHRSPNSKARRSSQSSQVVDNSARKRAKRRDKNTPTHDSTYNSTIKKEEKLDFVSANAVPISRLPSHLSGMAVRFQMTNHMYASQQVARPGALQIKMKDSRSNVTSSVPSPNKNRNYYNKYYNHHTSPDRKKPSISMYNGQLAQYQRSPIRMPAQINYNTSKTIVQRSKLPTVYNIPVNDESVDLCEITQNQYHLGQKRPQQIQRQAWSG